MNSSSSLVRIAKCSILAFAVLLGLSSQVVRADLPRTPVRTVPQLFGRDIERFVLLAPIVINRSKSGSGLPFAAFMMVEVPRGTFIPVSQDAEGIFYQAVNGFLRIRGNDTIGGGFYVSKLRPGEIWVYVGDAQMRSKRGVDKDRLPLPVSALHSLRVGKPERKQ
jgi:hypothetical protein